MVFLTFQKGLWHKEKQDRVVGGTGYDDPIGTCYVCTRAEYQEIKQRNLVQVSANRIADKTTKYYYSYADLLSISSLNAAFYKVWEIYTLPTTTITFFVVSKNDNPT